MNEGIKPGSAELLSWEPDGADFTGIETRIYHGVRGRVVLTVEADDPAQTRLLARICGAAIEAVFFRLFRDRLLRD